MIPHCVQGPVPSWVAEGLKSRDLFIGCAGLFGQFVRFVAQLVEPHGGVGTGQQAAQRAYRRDNAQPCWTGWRLRDDEYRSVGVAAGVLGGDVSSVTGLMTTITFTGR
jgi:hypothetical protein